MTRLGTALALALLLSGCQVGDSSTFVPHSHIPSGNNDSSLGVVSAQDCQRYWLYLLPSGDAPTTRKALEKALAVKPGTHFLADMSVDNRMEIGIGYRDDCILVEGVAFGPGNGP